MCAIHTNYLIQGTYSASSGNLIFSTMIWSICNCVCLYVSFCSRLNEVLLVGPNSTLCGRAVQETHLVGDSAFSAESFVAVAILAFCYSMAALLIYLGYMDSYRDPQGSSWPQIVSCNTDTVVLNSIE